MGIGQDFFPCSVVYCYSDTLLQVNPVHHNSLHWLSAGISMIQDRASLDFRLLCDGVPHVLWKALRPFYIFCFDTKHVIKCQTKGCHGISLPLYYFLFNIFFLQYEPSCDWETSTFCLTNAM